MKTDKEKMLTVNRGAKITLGTEADFELAAIEITNLTGGSSLGGGMSTLWGFLDGDTTRVDAELAESLAREAKEFKTLFGKKLSQRAKKLLDKLTSLSSKEPVVKNQAAPRKTKSGKMTTIEKRAFYEELDKNLTQNLPITQEFEDKLDVVLVEDYPKEAAEFVSQWAYAEAKKRLAAKKKEVISPKNPIVLVTPKPDEPREKFVERAFENLLKALKTKPSGTATKEQVKPGSGNAPKLEILEEKSPKKSTARHIIVGDIHGELTGFKEILAHAGLIDKRGDWSGKEAVLVQTGDVIDRGPHSVEAVQFLRKLQTQAATAGGRVVRLCGNHELMLIQGNSKYINFNHPAELKCQLQEEILAGKVLAAYTDGTRLYTHAGLRTQIREEVESGAPPSSQPRKLKHLADRLNQIFVDALKAGDLKTHPIFHVDEERGGRHEVGGIFWGDLVLIEGSERAYDVPQIFGHTPTKKSGVKHSHGLSLIDIDAGMFIGYGGNRVYLEMVGDGEVFEHSLKKGKWYRTLLSESDHS